ncbi:MAG: replicative DNA helicase [Alphaproteobacteria bacterium]|jgi:replicative DNA helicase
MDPIETNVTTMHGNAPDGNMPSIRTPPHNTEIEAALLGAVLTNNRAFDKISDFLRPQHFFEPVHARIFESASKLVEMGQVASPQTLRHIFESDELLREVGGPQYLYELAASVVSVINAGDYAKTVYDLYLRRELIGLGEDVVNDAYSGDIDVTAQDQIEGAEQRLYDLATTGDAERGAVDLGAAAKAALAMAEDAFKNKGKVVGVSTGLSLLDRKLGGLHQSDLIILAGRPSMGKTALATNIAFNAAKAALAARSENSDSPHTGPVLFFSLEMAAEQLATRILSEQSEVPSDQIRRGEVEQEEFHRFVQATQDLSRVPLMIDDTPALSISAVRTRARRMKRQHGGLSLILVDYLQLLQGPPGRNNDNRVNEIGEISRGLKTLAKELEVPVIALSQLSRQVENRDDKRPQLSDLRESGSIEQDADVVMFIFREEYYLEKAEPIQGVEETQERFSDRAERWAERIEQVRSTASVIIAKQRHGPVGTIDLYFEGRLTRFSDLDRFHDDDSYS